VLSETSTLWLRCAKPTLPSNPSISACGTAWCELFGGGAHSTREASKRGL